MPVARRPADYGLLGARRKMTSDHLPDHSPVGAIKVGRPALVSSRPYALRTPRNAGRLLAMPWFGACVRPVRRCSHRRANIGWTGEAGFWCDVGDVPVPKITAGVGGLHRALSTSGGSPMTAIPMVNVDRLPPPVRASATRPTLRWPPPARCTGSPFPAGSRPG